MYGFGSDLPIQKLLDQTVWWVCFSENGLRFEFENGDSIIVYYFNQFCIDNFKCNEELINILISLNSQKILSIKYIEVSKIQLIFTNGVSLFFHDQIHLLENFEFYIDGKYYTV